jgi:hypothetical protein
MNFIKKYWYAKIKGNCMTLTVAELRAYRSCIGLQVQYAQAGDSHKVMELQHQLEGWISRCAQNKIKAAMGETITLVWSDEAKEQYRKRCADAMTFADKGFDHWVLAQQSVEEWVSDYIQQGVFQATIKIDQLKK